MNKETQEELRAMRDRVLDLLKLAPSLLHPDWAAIGSLRARDRYVYVCVNHPMNPNANALWLKSFADVSEAAYAAIDDLKERDWAPLALVDLQTGDVLKPTFVVRWCAS